MSRHQYSLFASRDPCGLLASCPLSCNVGLALLCFCCKHQPTSSFRFFLHLFAVNSDALSGLKWLCKTQVSYCKLLMEELVQYLGMHWLERAFSFLHSINFNFPAKKQNNDKVLLEFFSWKWDEMQNYRQFKLVKLEIFHLRSYLVSNWLNTGRVFWSFLSAVLWYKSWYKWFSLSP